MRQNLRISFRKPRLPQYTPPSTRVCGQAWKYGTLHCGSGRKKAIEEEISELRNILCKRQKEILTILDKMEPEYASVLSGRFIEGKSVKELRTVLFLSRRQIERRMNDALAEFQIKLNDLIEHGDLPWPA